MRNSQRESTFQELPDELKFMISTLLQSKEFIIAAMVSKTWRVWFTCDLVWQTVWQKYQRQILIGYGCPWPEHSSQNGYLSLPLYKILQGLRHLEGGQNSIGQNSRYLFFAALNQGSQIYFASFFSQLADDNKWLSYESIGNFGHIVARVGNLQLLKWLIENKALSPTWRMLHNAIESGNPALIYWLINKKNLRPDQERSLRIASSSCATSICQWLVKQKGLLPNKAVLDAAAMAGNYDLVRWYIDEKNLSPNDETLKNSLKSGNLALVKWLILEKNIVIKPVATQCAALSGNLELLQWTIQNGKLRLTPYVLNKAAQSGNLEMVKWLVEDCGLHVSKSALHEAASTNLAVLQWLFKSAKGKIKPNQDTLYSAICYSGRLPIVKWLIIEQGVRLDKQTYEWRKESRNAALEKWLDDYKLQKETNSTIGDPSYKKPRFY